MRRHFRLLDKVRSPLLIMVTYKSRFLTRGEVWFDNEPDDTRAVDWIIYHQRSRPVAGAKVRYFYTYAIDLTQSSEQLLANLNRDTAYKIRRARGKDGIICERGDPSDPSVMTAFEQMYNQFAAMKGLPRLNRARMESMAAAGVLDLSAAKDPQGNVLVYHANYRDRCRATGIELPSLYRARLESAARNLVGRANRYLTWNDILHYREAGLKCFDFGGWYHGTDPAMIRINDFKRGFGGKVLREYQCEEIRTLKGWAVTQTAAVLNWARRVRARLRPLPPPPEAEATTHEPEAGMSSAPTVAETLSLPDSRPAK